MDCGIDTGKAHEFYFIDTDLWLSVVKSIEGQLCISCLEIRMGRELVPEDFTDAFINDPKRNQMSDRLRSRITGC